MSHNICFIGDSHVAALRQALDDPRTAAHADRITIFGSRGSGLFSLREEDGALVTDEKKVRQDLNFTGGARRIKLGHYDAFCIVGGLVKLQRVDDIVEHYATVGMGLTRRHLVSERLLAQMFEEAMRQTLTFHLLGLVAGSGKPLFHVPCPLPSEDIVTHWKGSVLRTIVNAGVAEDHFRRFSAAREKIIGGMAAIIAQPDSTVAAPFFTKREYGLGSVRLARQQVEHGDDDFNHMNKDYGVEMLNRAMAVIDAALASAVSAADDDRSARAAG